MNTTSISRRELLKGTGALGALFVSFSLPLSLSDLLAQSGAPAPARRGLDPTSLDAWLAVGQDETVTVFTIKVELGTGTETALAQIVAEELDVDFKQIRMDTGDTDRTIDQQSTVASRTVEKAGPQLRQAAAAARQELLKLASARLQTPVDQLTVAGGVVSVIGDPSKRISYGSLIGNRRFDVRITATGVGYDLVVAPEVRAKDSKAYRIVGTSAPRLDLPEKFTGEFTYVHDVRVPGMLHGRVVRPPVINSKPLKIDEASIAQIPGIVKVVQEESFLGVVAETEWAAIRAARALKVTWSDVATKLPASKEAVYTLLKDTKSYQDQVAANVGNSETGLAGAARTFDATYRWPFQAPGMLGPSCAVADVRGDRATLWAGSQGPFRTRDGVAALLKIPPPNVRVIYHEASGCYGRLNIDDVADDAALMSRAVGRPVRVQWMREDENGWDTKGPAHVQTVRAGVDAQGRIVAWDFMDRTFPWTEASDRPGMYSLAARQVGFKPFGQGVTNGTGAGGQLYEFENKKVVGALIPWVQPDPTPLRTGSLRAPGDPARCFASETFLDYIASEVGVDPVELRRRYLGRNVRAIAVLDAAAERAGWQPRRTRRGASGNKVAGRGVALSTRSNTFVAAVADVEVDKPTGKVTVRRVTVAHDCGLIVNPDGLKNQIEGNTIQAVSRTLLEEVRFDGTGLKSLDWRSYPILTFEDVPDVDIVLINHPEMPALGAGEPAVTPVAAAIANALFDATGVRLREVPLTPARVQAALKTTA